MERVVLVNNLAILRGYCFEPVFGPNVHEGFGFKPVSRQRQRMCLDTTTLQRFVHGSEVELSTAQSVNEQSSYASRHGSTHSTGQALPGSGHQRHTSVRAIERRPGVRQLDPAFAT